MRSKKWLYQTPVDPTHYRWETERVHEINDNICCHGNCLQGRACPYREACGPIEPEAPVADRLLKTAAWIAAVLAVGMVVLAAGVGV